MTIYLCTYTAGTCHLVKKVTNKFYPFRSKKRIEFRDSTDLNRVILSHSVAPHEPGVLYAVSSSLLLYMDSSEGEVQQLDLRESERILQPRCFIKFSATWLNDACVVHDHGKQLVICANGLDGARAWDMSTGTVCWRVDGQTSGMDQSMDVRGVTSDGSGHLFVSDTENGNKVLSAADGQYLGRCNIKGLGQPSIIRWNEETSSLVSVCQWRRKLCLKVIKVQCLEN